MPKYFLEQVTEIQDEFVNGSKSLQVVEELIKDLMRQQLLVRLNFGHGATSRVEFRILLCLLRFLFSLWESGSGKRL